MKWFDKSSQRYMQNISKEEDMELEMAKRVYLEKMSPEDAVVDMIQTNEDVVSAKECIDAWNRVALKNHNINVVALRLLFVGLLVWILAFILAIL